MQVVALAFMLYTRVVFFFPVCVRLTPAVFTECAPPVALSRSVLPPSPSRASIRVARRHGAAAGWTVAVSLLLFTLFNVLAIFGNGASCLVALKAVRGSSDEELPSPLAVCPKAGHASRNLIEAAIAVQFQGFSPLPSSPKNGVLSCFQKKP